MATSTQTRTQQPPDRRAVFLLRGDRGYDEAVSAWSLLGSHHPMAVMLARHPEDIVEAVRYARSEGLGVGVMATGHGSGIPVTDGVLINTSRMKGLSVDPISRIARVEPGVLWGELNDRAARHGLIGLQGSSSQIGVVGFSLGGGLNWLGRRFGFASQSIVSADLVTATGERITVNDSQHPDLFWALKGSAGNVGVVSALEVRLFEVDVVYGGAMFYPWHRATEVLTAYASWAAEQPDEMSTSAVLMNVPPLPALPEQLRGQTFASVQVCYSGDDLGVGVAAVRDLRRRLGPAAIDQIDRLPASATDRISADPTEPIPALLHGELLPELSPQVIDRVVAAFPADSSLSLLEIRQLGGALTTPPDVLSPINRTGARFSLNAIGVAPDPARRTAVENALAGLRDALAPFVDGAGYVNFLDGPGGAARIRSAFADADWHRLVTLKQQWDPDSVFRFNRFIGS